MTRNASLLAAVVAAQLVAGAALAQATPDEYGRTSAGELELIGKQTQKLSGSFSISSTTSPLGIGGSGRGYDATLGGTLVKDRVWFFASAQQSPTLITTQFANTFATSGVDQAMSRALNAKMNAQLGDHQSLVGAFSTQNLSAPNLFTGTLPSSFMTLHYTGIVSNNMFFTANVSESKAR